MKTHHYPGSTPLIGLHQEQSTPGPQLSFGGTDAQDRAAHAEMLHRAYSIWECKGRPQHSDLADWLEAEAEMKKEVGS